jgi:hypothetical protein
MPAKQGDSLLATVKLKAEFVTDVHIPQGARFYVAMISRASECGCERARVTVSTEAADEATARDMLALALFRIGKGLLDASTVEADTHG